MQYPTGETINGLWIGAKLGPLEQLTILSFIRQGHPFRLWVYDIPTGLPNSPMLELASGEKILPRDRIFRYLKSSFLGHGKNSVAGFSDVFRYQLLWEFGGWWSDLDVTCLTPLNFNDPYVFRSHHILKMVGNIMYCPPKSILMARCLEDANRMVHANNRDWMLPIRILNKHIKELDLSPFIQDFTNQDSWCYIRNLLGSRQPTIAPHWKAIHWNHTDWNRMKLKTDEAVPGSMYADLLSSHHISFRALKSEEKKRIERCLTISWFVWRTVQNRWRG